MPLGSKVIYISWALGSSFEIWGQEYMCLLCKQRKKEKMRWEKRKERREKERRGQDRTGQDRTGQDRKGRDLKQTCQCWHMLILGDLHTWLFIVLFFLFCDIYILFIKISESATEGKKLIQDYFTCHLYLFFILFALHSYTLNILLNKVHCFGYLIYVWN